MPMLLRGRAGPQAAQHRDKRRTERRKTTDRDLPPPQFWDNLSHIPLVKRALRELDRRNNRLQSREQGLESSRPSPGDPRQLEGDIEYQAIKRFSRTGGPDLSDLRGYAYSPTEPPPPSEHLGRRRRRSNMPGRGSTHRGRTSVSGLGKRRRNAVSDSAESEDEPRARGSGHARQSRARGRGRMAGVRHKPVTAARDKSTTTTTATSTKSGPYDPAFTQHLIDYNVIPLDWYWRHGERPEPAININEIKAEVRTARDPEPDEDFQRFQNDYRKASHEDNILSLLDILEGDSETLSQSHVIRQKKKMVNLRPLTDGSLKPGNPDRVYGAPANDLKVSIRKDLGDVIVPTRQRDFICPNFVVHAKSDEGNLTVARAQAAYDGALAARGMQSLWDYGGTYDAAPARVARVITCTWAAGVLKMYATYCQEEPAAGDGALAESLAQNYPRYVPSLIGSWIMTDEEDHFRGGLTAYRNGLDWAKKQRDMAISRANGRAEAEQARRHSAEEQNADRGDRREGEGSPEEENRRPSSIYARRRPEARGQGRDQDSDAAEEGMHGSFDSQRTMTRSMYRKQLNGKNS